MKVLKFGGTSVGSAANMQIVINITRKQSETEQAIIVVSAMSGTTDSLLKSGEFAAAGDEAYKEILRGIENRHLETVKELMPVQQQSSLLSLVKKLCNGIEDICNGIFLLGEFSAGTKDKLAGYGELLSSQIIAAVLVSRKADVIWKDARDLIRTDSQFGNAMVDFAVTNKQVAEYASHEVEKSIIIPGFIASDARHVTTTLGRGGSDYTASII